MKLAIITPGITPYVMGGLQRHSFNLARCLARLGAEVDLYHTDFADANGIDGLEGMDEGEKCRIHSIAIPWPGGRRLPGHYLRKMDHFSDVVLNAMRKRPRVDFIYAKSLTGGRLMKAKQTGEHLPPIGVNFHGFEMFQPPPSWRAWAEGRMMRPVFAAQARRADFVFSYGGKITQIIEQQLSIPADRILEIPGGIDQEWIGQDPAPARSPRRFLFVGRSERRKGIHELNQAIGQLQDRGFNCEFRFVGPIPESQRLNLSNVSYAGAVRGSAELQQELRSADVLLCPSHSEGMPNSILEGMGAGLAILASDVGAVRLAVGPDNGILLDRVDAASVRSALETLIQLPQNELQQLKVESLRKVREFSWKRIARLTLTKIEAALERSVRRSMLCST